MHAGTQPLRVFGVALLMADSTEYFWSHALAALRKARSLPLGRERAKQRMVARVCHLLAKQGARSGHAPAMPSAR